MNISNTMTVINASITALKYNLQLTQRYYKIQECKSEIQHYQKSINEITVHLNSSNNFINNVCRVDRRPNLLSLWISHSQQMINMWFSDVIHHIDQHLHC